MQFPIDLFTQFGKGYSKSKEAEQTVISKITAEMQLFHTLNSEYLKKLPVEKFKGFIINEIK